MTDRRENVELVNAKDKAGNPASKSVTVTVPHDQGGKR
jgi:hypothetical protein